MSSPPSYPRPVGNVTAAARAATMSVGSPVDETLPQDLSAIYREHADNVARWARRLAGPELDIEDIVHEVFLVAQRRLGEWRGDAKISTWLYEITVRVVQGRRRRQRFLKLLPGQRGAAGEPDLGQIPADDPNPLDLLERREATEALYRILDGIGEKYRTVIILFELEGLSGQEIAEITGSSLANVWVRLFRGREKMLKRFVAWEGKGAR